MTGPCQQGTEAAGALCPGGAVPMTPSVGSSDPAFRPGAALLGFLHGAKQEIYSCFVDSITLQSRCPPLCHLPPTPCHNLFETHFLSDIGFAVAASTVHGKALNLHFSCINHLSVRAWDRDGTRSTSPVEVTRKRARLVQ